MSDPVATMRRFEEMDRLLDEQRARIRELEAVEEEHRALNGRLRADARDLAGALRVMLGVAKRCLADGTMGREALEAEVAEAEAVLLHVRAG